VVRVLLQGIPGSYDLQWVTGCASGIDEIPFVLKDLYDEYETTEIHRFPVTKEDWDTHGKKAGYLRNQVMAEYCDAAIIIWDGKSKGTKHMIDIMFEYPDKPTIIYKVT